MLPSLYLFFPTLALEWVESVFVFFLKVVKIELSRFGNSVAKCEVNEDHFQPIKTLTKLL